MNIEGKKKFLVDFCFWIAVITLIYLCFKFLLPFLVPFLLGFAVAYLLRKPIQYCTNKLHIKQNISAILFVSLFYIIIGLFIIFVGLGAIYGIQSFISELPELYTKYAEDLVWNIASNIENFLVVMGNNTELIAMIDSISGEIVNTVGGVISSISSYLLSGVSNIATSIPGFFIKMMLMIISTFFIEIYTELNTLIMNFFSKQIGSKVSNLITEVKDYLFGTVFVCLKSYIIIMTITFVELSIGLTLIGIDNSIIIALLISIFDVLPVLGTGGIMIPWAIIEFILGDIKLGVLLSIVYLVVTIIRNIIEPKIVGKELGLHPLVTLVSMFIGVNIAGIVGLFGAPILLSLLVHLNEKGTISLIK